MSDYNGELTDGQTDTVLIHSRQSKRTDNVDQSYPGAAWENQYCR